MDGRVADRKRALDILGRHQLVEPDVRSVQYLQLVDHRGGVGIEVHLRLLQVQPRHRPDVVFRFDDAQPLARKVERGTQVAQARFLPDQVVVFAGYLCRQVFDRQTGVQFAHHPEFFQPGVFRLDVQPVEYRPVEGYSRVEALRGNAVGLFDRSVGSHPVSVVIDIAGVSAAQVQGGQVAGIAYRRVVSRLLLFAPDDAHRVVVLQSAFDAILQTDGLCRRRCRCCAAEQDNQPSFFHSR